jgi:DNA repair ATPase RecN
MAKMNLKVPEKDKKLVKELEDHKQNAENIEEKLPQIQNQLKESQNMRETVGRSYMEKQSLAKAMGTEKDNDELKSYEKRMNELDQNIKKYTDEVESLLNSQYESQTQMENLEYIINKRHYLELNVALWQCRADNVINDNDNRDLIKEIKKGIKLYGHKYEHPTFLRKLDLPEKKLY